MTATKLKNAPVSEKEPKIKDDDAKQRPEIDRKQLVDHVELNCEAVLGTGKITIGRLDALTAGDTIALDSSPADPVQIQVNGKTIARGVIVTMDDRFAIRLTEVG